ncbi:ent-kaurenoic acid oxidase 1-like [Hibiscus syriacus]|uniref:ent-kaurenoic acid oxidase 1-like n=1 Tax=Hibiscus syriacus TaxID=106335 RepID=UPI001924537D|nr:ent-kaurenoic acid oxidase 1-like [Hibiscus syriacus]
MDIMGSMWLTVALATLGAFSFLKWVLKSLNPWVYESPLGDLRYSLPPGDLGWPVIRNMWSFLRAFRSVEPDSFMGSFVSRFGRTGIYKAFMFGCPSVIVTTPETSRKVLNDDDAFKPGWPTSTTELIGKKSFIGISYEEHKRLRRLTAAPVNGHEALSIYIPYIEEIVISTLDKWSKMGKIEFLTWLIFFMIVTQIPLQM